MATIQENLTIVVSQAKAAALRATRNFSEIKILAATKSQSAERVIEYLHAATALGIHACYGENYIQEFAEKSAKLPLGLPPVETHFIGTLQSNKAKDAVRFFDVIEGVASKSGYEAVAKEAKKISKRQRILLQVNISDDSGKGGFTPEATRQIAPVIFADERVQLVGLMTITKFYDQAEGARGDFRALRSLRDEIRLQSGVAANEFTELSMGMSHDFEVAIEEGATIVRVGTGIFGARKV